jgi:Na+/melibiose symporter-like transporter
MLCAPHLPKWLHHEEDHGHINGGNLLQVETSSKLIERFISQQQNDQIVVHWEGQDDKENPYNWSLSKRISLCFMAALAVLNCTFASSAPSGVIPDMRAYFGFDAEVATLTISIFVAGYCVGPTIWGPLSERIGRRLIFLISMLLYTAWNVGCALSRNTASILVFRFLAGTAAAAPLSNSGGVIADIVSS